MLRQFPPHSHVMCRNEKRGHTDGSTEAYAPNSYNFIIIKVVLKLKKIINDNVICTCYNSSLVLLYTYRYQMQYVNV